MSACINVISILNHADLPRSLIPSKKEFWLDDSAVSPSNLSLYLRGEKPEVAHPVVAWASQTGKGLLFFNKKGEINRAHPHDILPLYDATELKKEHPHSFSFKINGKEHSFKATSDAERDGWYISIEKSIELGKASKQEVRDTAGYTEEFEKLSKLHVSCVEERIYLLTHIYQASQATPSQPS